MRWGARMSGASKLVAAGLALPLAACSIQPQIEDFTGITGRDVVVFTRCQARAGLRAHFVEVMRAYGPTPVYENRTGEQIAKQIEENPTEFSDLKYAKLRSAPRRLVDFYKDSAITYDFTIESNEVNTAGFDLTVRRTFSNGLNRFGIALQNDRTRDAKFTQRHFDTFDSLFHLPESYCGSIPKHANLLFPSTGLTRVSEVIGDFTRANQNHNLIGDKETPNIPERTATITFTTRTAANFGPGWEIDPVRGAYIATSVGAKSDNSRQDKHQIIVIVQGADPKNKKNFDQFGRLVSTEQALRQSGSAAVERVIERNYLQSFGTPR